MSSRAWMAVRGDAVIDAAGRPVALELWPGNVTDITTLIPVVDRLPGRFGLAQVPIAADAA